MGSGGTLCFPAGYRVGLLLAFCIDRDYDEFVDLCYRSDTASALWLCLFQMDFQVSNDLNRLSDTASALCLFQMDFQASNNVA
jgi:hypothetical protein